MDDDLDLREIDRQALFQAIADCQTAADFGVEYESYCWVRDMLYLLDEGFIEMTDNGRLYSTDFKCPNHP